MISQSNAKNSVKATRWHQNNNNNNNKNGKKNNNCAELSVVQTSSSSAVNDSCSLKDLLWGHFPPGKHKVAYEII